MWQSGSHVWITWQVLKEVPHAAAPRNQFCCSHGLPAARCRQWQRNSFFFCAACEGCARICQIEAYSLWRCQGSVATMIDAMQLIWLVNPTGIFYFWNRNGNEQTKHTYCLLQHTGIVSHMAMDWRLHQTAFTFSCKHTQIKPDHSYCL